MIKIKAIKSYFSIVLHKGTALYTSNNDTYQTRAIAIYCYIAILYMDNTINVQKGNESSTVQFYRNSDLRSKDIFKVEFLGFELVRITNLRLDAKLWKPVIESQHNFTTEVISGHLTRIAGNVGDLIN